MYNRVIYRFWNFDNSKQFIYSLAIFQINSLNVCNNKTKLFKINEQIAVKLLQNDQTGYIGNQLLLTYAMPLPIVLFNALTNGLLIAVIIRSK